jgi:hypothetical protein
MDLNSHPNGENLNYVIQTVEKYLKDTVSIHGEILRVSKIGNSIVIYFKDGNVYKQPLITLERNVAVLDDLR